MNPGQYANKEQEIQHLKDENARLLELFQARNREVIRLREAKRQALVVQAYESQRANNFEIEVIRLRKLLIAQTLGVEE